MSASETVPTASNLHNSIEQLIAETVRQSQSTHEEEKQKLINALATALGEIETGQQALNRAADALRAALGQEIEAESTAATVEIEPPSNEETPDEAPMEATEPTSSNRGPHDLNVIAHDASIGNARDLQELLRGQPEVTRAQTREFVNGELRLQLALSSALDMAALDGWLSKHDGMVVTSTDSVIEIRFGA